MEITYEICKKNLKCAIHKNNRKFFLPNLALLGGEK